MIPRRFRPVRHSDAGTHQRDRKLFGHTARKRFLSGGCCSLGHRDCHAVQCRHKNVRSPLFTKGRDSPLQRCRSALAVTGAVLDRKAAEVREPMAMRNLCDGRTRGTSQQLTTRTFEPNITEYSERRLSDEFPKLTLKRSRRDARDRSEQR
jgi:hypothetical protein